MAIMSEFASNTALLTENGCGTFFHLILQLHCFSFNDIAASNIDKKIMTMNPEISKRVVGFILNITDQIMKLLF